MNLSRLTLFLYVSFCLLAIVPCTVIGAPVDGAPVLLYTDISSGPNTGGENNKGIYLSLFGKNFGSKGLAKTIKVFIGGAEVDNYRSLGPSRGRKDIQQITVQIGALGSPQLGVPLPIEIVINGVRSQGNVTFTVNPGRILFVDNVKGNDRTAAIGDVDRPFRHVQTKRLQEGAWGEARSGDFLVLRGTGTPWTDRGYQNYFLRVRDKSGTAPTGRSNSGPITIMGYPGEDVHIYQPYDAELEKSGTTGAISAVNGISFPGMGEWVTISNLRIEAGGHNGAINTQIQGNHWRIVNNELTAATAINNDDAKAGGIVGNGHGEIWMGNSIHDVFCGPAGTGPLHNHGIYIDGDGSYEIAYNVIEDIPGGSGFQIYANGSNGSSTAGNISFHHNLIRRVGKHGINLADGSSKDIMIYNNVITDTSRAGLRINSVNLRLARVYNNTFYNTNTDRKPGYGAIMNDWHLPPDALDLQNNIFVPASGTQYAAGSVGFSGNVGIINRNFWHQGNGNYHFDRSPRTGNLKPDNGQVVFSLHAKSGTVDTGSSDVGWLITNDYDVTTTRPQGAGFDIGAHEWPQQGRTSLKSQ